MNASRTNRISTPQRAWRFPRVLVDDQLGLLLVVWARFLVTVMVMVFGVSRFRDITISGYEVASGIAMWYVGGIAWYVLHRTLPMFLAHGRTRRDTAIEIAILLAIFTATAAVLISVGYLVEYVLYGFAGWPRELSDDHLFSSHTDLVMQFIEYWLTFLVWAAAGALIGAAFYRYDGNGWLAIIPAMLLIALIDLATGASTGPLESIVDWVLMVDRPSLPLAITFTVISVAAALAMIWPIIRDMPLRNR